MADVSFSDCQKECSILLCFGSSMVVLMNAGRSIKANQFSLPGPGSGGGVLPLISDLIVLYVLQMDHWIPYDLGFIRRSPHFIQVMSMQPKSVISLKEAPNSIFQTNNDRLGPLESPATQTKPCLSCSSCLEKPIY